MTERSRGRSREDPSNAGQEEPAEIRKRRHQRGGQATRTCPPDQWCLPEDGVEVQSIGFHFLRLEDMTPGDFWLLGAWDPHHEVPPL